MYIYKIHYTIVVYKNHTFRNGCGGHTVWGDFDWGHTNKSALRRDIYHIVSLVSLVSSKVYKPVIEEGILCDDWDAFNWTQDTHTSILCISFKWNKNKQAEHLYSSVFIVVIKMNK